MIWSVFVTFAIMCVGFGQVVHHACSQLGHLVLQHLTALDNQNSIIIFSSFVLTQVSGVCPQVVLLWEAALANVWRALIAKKTLGKRCDLAGQVIVDKLATTFVPMWCGALWSHKDSLQWLIALKCKPHSTLQLQIFAESLKLSMWLLQVWVQFSPHTQYENINGPVVFNLFQYTPQIVHFCISTHTPKF